MSQSIPHTYQDKHGAFYVRFVFPNRVRNQFKSLSRDIHRSLHTKSPKVARRVSRRYISYWEQLIELLDMAQYRNKQFYLDLIKARDPFQPQAAIEPDDSSAVQELQLIHATDPFGNPVSLDFGDPDIEADKLIQLQKEWAGIRIDHERRLVEMRAEFAASPAKLAALNADYLKAYHNEQASNDYSVEEVVDVFVREKSKAIVAQSVEELRPGLEHRGYLIQQNQRVYS